MGAVGLLHSVPASRDHSVRPTDGYASYPGLLVPNMLEEPRDIMVLPVARTGRILEHPFTTPLLAKAYFVSVEQISPNVGPWSCLKVMHMFFDC